MEACHDVRFRLLPQEHFPTLLELLQLRLHDPSAVYLPPSHTPFHATIKPTCLRCASRIRICASMSSLLRLPASLAASVAACMGGGAVEEQLVTCVPAHVCSPQPPPRTVQTVRSKLPLGHVPRHVHVPLSAPSTSASRHSGRCSKQLHSKGGGGETHQLLVHTGLHRGFPLLAVCLTAACLSSLRQDAFLQVLPRAGFVLCALFAEETLAQ